MTVTTIDHYNITMIITMLSARFCSFLLDKCRFSSNSAVKNTRNGLVSGYYNSYHHITMTVTTIDHYNITMTVATTDTMTLL